ncbi:hypothetical protein MWU78_03155 [Arenibacter sp. F26102]|uniref:hypothetical protein n=1 Tax=Arenibacter sp. F26102 TaxID=2926416 RepID=UPI001FF18A95|nr:hypothetical protein [Arenibacter sp. F26102]MCK0144641.1 hypothetical protein [Arenibacter sp. F26102]
MKHYLFLFIMLGLLVSCEKNEGNPSGIKKLGYGTSFEMCVGYCTNAMLLKSGSVIYTRSGWNDQVTPIECNETLTQISWDSFKKNSRFK